MELAINSIVVLLIFTYLFFQVRKLWLQLQLPVYKMALAAATILHLAMAVVFWLSIDKQDMQIDAVRYYTIAKQSENWWRLFGLGSSFMSFILYPLVKIKLSFEVVFFLFSALSLKGIFLFAELIGLRQLHLKNKWFLLYFLTPSLHFWTGFIGKEALLIVFMAIVLKSLKNKNFGPAFLASALFIFLIRPHVFLVMTVALVLVILLDKQIATKIKQKIVVAGAASLLIGIPLFVKYFLKFDLFDWAEWEKYANEFFNYTVNRGNTAINLSETNLLSRIGYLLFMPLPFLYPLHSIFQWAVAIENIALLLWVSVGLYYSIAYRKQIGKLSFDLRFALLAAVLLILLFASYLYNVGLGNRMRIMFYPFLFYFFIQVLPSKNSNVTKTH